MRSSLSIPNIECDFGGDDFADAVANARNIYSTYGAVIAKGLLNRDGIVSDIVSSLNRLCLEQVTRAVEERNISLNTEQRDLDQILLDLDKIDHNYVAKVYDLINFNPLVYGLAAERNLRRLVESLICDNSEILVTGFQLRMDLPDDQNELLGWHRDMDYFQGFPSSGTVAWIPIRDVTLHHGGISIIANNYAAGDLVSTEWEESRPGTTHKTKRFEIVEAVGFDTDTRRIQVTANAGDVVLFRLTTPHRSERNHANSIRWCAQIRWFPTNDPIYYGKTRGELSDQ